MASSDVFVCETACYLKDGNLFMRDRDRVVAMLKEIFPEQTDFLCAFRFNVKDKTDDQLGYFWNEPALILHEYLREAGNNFVDKEMSVEYWMVWILQYATFVHAPDGNLLGYPKKRISSMNQKELHWLTEELIRFLVSELNATVRTPEEWKKSKKIK